jgi:hypothetical protein
MEPDTSHLKTADENGPYEPPRVEMLGTFADLTRGKTGSKTDNTGASAGSL